MTEFLFGALAFLSMLGWGITNALTARNHLREANALDIEERVNSRIDDRVSAVLNRYRALKAKGTEEGGREKTVLDDETEAQNERRRQKLSMTESMPDDSDLGSLDEQPLDSVE